MMHPDVVSKRIQNAYCAVREHLQKSRKGVGTASRVLVNELVFVASAEVVDECMRRIEDYVCLRWYDALFCKEYIAPPIISCSKRYSCSEREEALDLALQTRIRLFHSETHIETCLDLTRAEVGAICAL